MGKVCLDKMKSSQISVCYCLLIEQEKPHHKFGFLKLIAKKLPGMAKTKLDLRKFRQNNHLLLIKMRVKLFRGGIPVIFSPGHFGEFRQSIITL